MNNFFLFSGTSNLALAQSLAKKLNQPLGKIEIIRFPDGEARVRILENVKDKTVYLLQSLSKPVDENLFELCLMADSAKRLGANNIIAIIPWLGYSKQDKEFRIGEAVSVDIIGKILSGIGLSKIIVFDLHSEIIKRYFKIPVVELSAKEVLYDGLKKEASNPSTHQKLAQDDFVIASPDTGGKGRSTDFAKDYKLPILYLKKVRDLDTGKISYEENSSYSSRSPKAAEKLDENSSLPAKLGSNNKTLTGKTCVIFDDIINQGGTVIKATEFLKKAGAEKIIVLATHGVLADVASKKLQNSLVDRIYLTDTINIPKEKQFDKLRIISIIDIIVHFLACPRK